MESKWSGVGQDAFFNIEHFDRNRIMKQPEYEISGRITKGAYYIISVDVGRKGCDTVATVLRVTPQSAGFSIKTLVNIYTLTDTHFEDQAIFLKRLYFRYKAQRMVIDANGIGIGLVDYMIKGQVDDGGTDFPPFGVYNDDDGYYKKYRTNNTEMDALYLIKASLPINSEAHVNLQVHLQTGRIKFLIDERVAKAKLLSLKRGQEMTAEERAEYLKPYTLTSILKEEMNLTSLL